jgi:ABC-type uncharacterized transport system auxiliary subunit
VTLGEIGNWEESRLLTVRNVSSAPNKEVSKTAKAAWSQTDLNVVSMRLIRAVQD